ncbi:MAG: iron-containing alcohol dehydrogenase PsrA [Marinosulfonomonas sp.]
MWTYRNPVSVHFGLEQFNLLPDLIGNRSYALVTYPDPPFAELTDRLAAVAGAPVVVVDDVAPNPDYVLLAQQCQRLAGTARPVEVIVALGGGSVIDSAKVFAAANGDFSVVQRFLETKQGGEDLSAIPIIAVPTTAGTGSEVTCWATVWKEETGQKYSLARDALYPEAAVIDPALMLAKPYGLTLATGLDALSHALESIWNVNANPVSARHAVFAAKKILATLPDLLQNLDDVDLRSQQAEASLAAGLAFSNTKTAIAHNLSYPITLGWGVQHGIACSFTLPTILRSVRDLDGFRGAALAEVFGPDLMRGADVLAQTLSDMGVGLKFSDHGVGPDESLTIVDDAFAGERGRNFIGHKHDFLNAARDGGVLSA